MRDELPGQCSVNLIRGYPGVVRLKHVGKLRPMVSAYGFKALANAIKAIDPSVATRFIDC
jgi:hypothetical protein